MSFVTSLDASSDINRRDSERRLVNTAFNALSGRGAAFTVVVHDISETGFRAEFASELHVGDEVRLRLGSSGFVSAEVVWRDGWDHGCRFVTPILPEEVKEALQTLTPVVGEEASVGADAPRRGFGRQFRARSRRLALLIVAALLLGEAWVLARMLL